MDRAKASVFTIGLAGLLVAALATWPEDPSSPAGSTSSADHPTSNMRASIEAGRENSTNPSAVERSRLDRGLRLGPEPESEPTPPLVDPSELPKAVRQARAEAFRGWHDHALHSLAMCMPPWTEAGEVRQVRVHFPPPNDTTEGEPLRLRADTVDALEPDVTVPDPVRRCFDELTGIELELPQPGPEQVTGHQEVLQVMWG